MRSEHDRKKEQQGKIYEERSNLAKQGRANDDLSQKIAQMEREEKNLVERISQLSETNYSKSKQIDDQGAKLGKCHREADDLKHELFRLDEDIRAVDKEN